MDSKNALARDAAGPTSRQTPIEIGHLLECLGARLHLGKLVHALIGLLGILGMGGLERLGMLAGTLASRELWRGISLFCLLSSAGLAIASGLYLLQIRETSGTLLGGLDSASAVPLLLLALLALGMGWLLGMSGAHLLWAMTFLLLGTVALYRWGTFPGDLGGNLFYSPTQDELSSFALRCGIALLPLLLPRRRLRSPGWLRWMLAGALALLCLCGLLLVVQQANLQSLPNCAFDRHTGQQLSICLHDEPQVLID